MRRTLAVSMLVIPLCAAAAPVQVERVRSYWNDEHTAIMSDVVVTNEDGSQECRRVFGGTVDGIGQVKIAVEDGLPIEYVWTTAVKSGAHLHWGGSCVFLTPNSRGTTSLPFSDVMTAFQNSADTWNGVTCSYLRFMLDAPENVDVGKDGMNVLVFREDHWAPGGSSNPSDAYNPLATAITTLSFIDDSSRSDNGTILDTDIEVNSVDFAMAVCDASHNCRTQATHGTIEDLQNTLTHELGHVVGLGHTCFTADAVHKTPPLDENGDPIPNCQPESLLPAKVKQATMYPTQVSGEITKRDLTDDDKNGDCAIYPLASDPNECKRVDFSKSGCDLGGGSPSWAALLLAAFALARARACSRSRRR